MAHAVKSPPLCAVVAATARITCDEMVLGVPRRARDIDHRAFLDDEVRCSDEADLQIDRANALDPHLHTR
jgi:hypothetical protein